MRVEGEARTTAILQRGNHIGAAGFVFAEGQVKAFVCEEVTGQLRQLDLASRRVFRIDADKRREIALHARCVRGQNHLLGLQIIG